MNKLIKLNSDIQDILENHEEANSNYKLELNELKKNLIVTSEIITGAILRDITRAAERRNLLWYLSCTETKKVAINIF